VLMELDGAAAARINGPATMDGIGPADDWERYWQGVDERRRNAAPWRSSGVEAGS
jgi:phthalate 4,5-dioxygenase oxygenase subunit